MTRVFRFLLIGLILSTSSFAGVRLPLHTLRYQGDTAHCWAYAASHMLESRALLREGLEFMVDIEQDTKYWVDYERFWAMYRTKNPEIYIGQYEGGWQMEYWDAFLKHGRQIKRSNILVQAQVLYPVLADFTDHIPFTAGPAYPSSTGLPSFSAVQEKLMGTFSSDAEVEAFIIDYLDRYYGKPKSQTQWLGQNVEMAAVPPKILGKDFADHSSLEGFVLIKPTTDGAAGWVKYLGERYWGYRYPKAQVLKLVQRSLDKGYPVTFDNVFHAMTIIGYETNETDTFYAVADSQPATIKWYRSASMLSNLNLVTFFNKAVIDQLPAKPEEWVNRDGINYDELDNTVYPPGSKSE